MIDFTEGLVNAIVRPQPLVAAQHEAIDLAASDTLAVAAAGFHEPVVRASLRAYPGDHAALWSGERCESREAAVFINATAAHALDFDDVFLDSHLHPSAVILPVVEATARNEADAYAAFSAGLTAGRAVAAALGPDHYSRGWHATGTVGAFAAAAAASRALELTEREVRSALALAGALAGGLQSNFGSMAKPCQAGFASAAGYRAANLARAGVAGSDDIFGRGGFLALYGHGEVDLPSDAFSWRPEQLSLKIFPSCFAAARLVGVALDARRELGQVFFEASVRVNVTVPAGSLAVLRYDRPRLGAEAKFSAPYNVAVALLDGTPTLAHFEDAAVGRADIRSCMDRVSMAEDCFQASGGSIGFGKVILEVHRGAALLGRFERAEIPGSAGDGASHDQLEQKWSSCLRRFEAASGRPFPLHALSVLRRVEDRLRMRPGRPLFSAR